MGADEGYDPRKSKVSDNTMMEWRHREATADLNEVPGVGPATIQKLAAVGVYNSYQLFAKYLSFREDKPGEPMSTVTHNDIFWYWLKDAGITSHRSAIVRAIAEKCATFFPKMHDANVYADEDDDDE